MKDTREVIPMENLGDRILSEISRNDSLSFTHMGYQKRVITWHPYPKAPPVSGYYLVSYRRGSMELVHTCLFTESGEFVANDKNIYAWAELPKPYEEESK